MQRLIRVYGPGKEYGFRVRQRNFMGATLNYSVIIPVYNRREKLLRALGSVSNLVRGPNVKVEIVVVDDASTDGSAEVARSAGADRLLLLDKNVGVTGAKNRGIAEASGDIFIFLDSDDELTADALLKIATHFDKNLGTDILFGACIDREGQVMHRSDAKFGEVSYKHLLVNNAPGEFLPVVRRKVFEKILFESDLRGFEGITWLKAARMGLGLYYCSEVLRIYDKEGEDRLCRRENIVKGADRLARGWQNFLGEFGSELWSLNKTAYFQTAFRWAVYSRIAFGGSRGGGLSPTDGWGLRQILTFGLERFCRIVPSIVWARYLNSR